MMKLSRGRLKRIYFTLLQCVGTQTSLLRKIARRDLLVVLNLHRVSPHPNPFWSPLHPKQFEELLVFLKRHFHVTSLAESAALVHNRPSAVLSFDDGYHDFIEYALPLLHKYRLPANQNIIPACVESGQPPWNIQLYDFLNAAPRILINEIRLDGFSHRLASEDVDAQVQYGLALSRFLKLRSQRERQPLWQALTTIMQKLNSVGTTRMMNLQEAQQIAGDYEIGAHSFSHESMEFESDEFFQEDLTQCFDFFAQCLRRPLTIYAFPNSSFRQGQIEMLERRGIRHILLVEDQFAKRGSRTYPRFAIYGESPAEVRFQALGYNARGVWGP